MHRFRDAAGALFERLADDVRLLEIGLIGVEDQGLPVKRVPEGVRVPGKPSLGHPSRVAHEERFGRVEKIVEVLGFDDPPVEGLVLDLVAPEVALRPSGCGRGGDREEQNKCRQPTQRRSSHTSPAGVPQLDVVPDARRPNGSPCSSNSWRRQTMCPGPTASADERRAFAGPACCNSSNETLPG